ncbi:MULTISPECIES: hypothetical protein [unclassified Pseudomonas]|uniref:hypothetical protein n=1 Tax=unclassified Pseudomonas TaxID=196821 RepID=UPI00128D0B6D|nr:MULTISPECIES: hypothetical protein [unclassified Pseudomonas]MPQ69654.1 hypothetical protein [Pseudomonas sp. MWU12-2323]
MYVFLQAARVVVQGIKALGIAASNRPGDALTHGNAVLEQRHAVLNQSYLDDGIFGFEGKAYVKAVAAAARASRAGNCEEQACLAFDMLASTGIAPLELMSLRNPVGAEGYQGPEIRGAITGIVEAGYAGPDHVFVVCGRGVQTNLQDPTTWNDDAVICDPWAKRAYFVADMADEMKLINRVSGGSMSTSQKYRFEGQGW